MSIIEKSIGLFKTTYTTHLFTGEVGAKLAAEALANQEEFRNQAKLKEMLIEHELGGHALNDKPMVQGLAAGFFRLDIYGLRIGRATFRGYLAKARYNPLGSRTKQEMVTMALGPKHPLPDDIGTVIRQLYS